MFHRACVFPGECLRQIIIYLFSPFCLSVCLSVCLSDWLSVCLSVCLTVCLTDWLSVCLSVCLHICSRLIYCVCKLLTSPCSHPIWRKGHGASTASHSSFRGSRWLVSCNQIKRTFLVWIIIPNISLVLLILLLQMTTILDIESLRWQLQGPNYMFLWTGRTKAMVLSPLVCTLSR